MQNILNKDSINITFVGDIMQHPKQIEYYLNNYYDMSDTFKEILPILKKTDFLVGCLETTFSGKPYTSGYPIPNKIMRFSTPNIFSKVLKQFGFNLLNTAQNHILDHGESGLLNTEKVLIKNDLKYVGIHNYLHNRIVNIKGIDVAFHNYTRLLNVNPKDFVTHVNDIVSGELVDSDTPEYWNLPKDYKYVSILPRIEDIKIIPGKINIITIHWGDELSKENEEQKSLAKFLIDKGFNAVIGSHSHNPQSIIHYDSSAIVYSLGNFISDQMHWILKTKPSEKGLIVNLNFNKNGINSFIEYYLIESLVQNSGQTEIRIIDHNYLKNDIKEFNEDLYDYSLINKKYKKNASIK